MRQNSVRRAVIGIAGYMLIAAPGAAASCIGDCNGDGEVGVDEVIRGVTIALGDAPLSDCDSFDANHDGSVTIDELIGAVGKALDGCPPAQQQAFVVTTDFQTGSFATISLTPPRTVAPSSPGRRINSDAVSRTFEGLIYVVNRFNADNIQVIDPQRDFATVAQCSTGNGSNPTDMAFASASKAYVARLQAAKLLVVNPHPRPDCSDFELGDIDLSAYADSDGIPEMNQLAVVGNRLYVTLQRLQNFMPAEHGAIAIIDLATDTPLGTITLSGENPFAQSKGLTVLGNSLVVAEAGKFGVNDGGIESIDLGTNTAQGYFITEAELGGDITDFVLLSAHLAYALVARPDFTNLVVAFDPSAGQVIRTILGPGSYSDIELNDRGELFVADRAVTQPGIRILRASDGTELTAVPLDVGLPPFDIVFFP